MLKYRVHWKSLLTGKKGQLPGAFSEKEAEALAEEKTEEVPNNQLLYWTKFEPFKPNGYQLSLLEADHCKQLDAESEG